MRTIRAQQWFAHRLWRLAQWLNDRATGLFHQPFCARRVTCNQCGKRHWQFRRLELHDFMEQRYMPVCRKCYDSIPF